MSEVARGLVRQNFALWLTGSDSREKHEVEVRSCVIAGWTGRDRDALEAHIRELEKLGVKRPASVPIFYRVSVSRLSIAEVVEVVGNSSSGEVEYVLLQWGGRLWVGLGSDHTDREAETIDVTLSKQLCDKPIATELWAYDELREYWDELILRSFIISDGERVLYQEGTVAAMRRPSELIELYAGTGVLPEGTLMFCGTLAVHGEIRPSGSFEMELADPRRGRSIRKTYHVEPLRAQGWRMKV
ncbi:DUF2848 domain-containing protein [Bradyrhizobium sp. KB893862 SZCCT0404]|uniref:DUF2848 domain-containing protein n=1 Tax=Bradyrhizobium sp. KB893862 SZCCT0404 TaxID=2807672 RepID=UPI001BAC141C|nr:DUF2848 domain-containing protein [Bradyrhizobium sp. KB893862 SZCCT0404]MBR1176998.1 DUF2848 domain-containing protein [Bradyrhizobium sp. KB893862 SZCCT0404]